MSLTPAQSESLDAQLLLHAAGELSVAEADALDAALSADAALLGRLQTVRDDFAFTADAFESTSGQAHISESRAVPRAVDAIRRWQLGQPVQAAPEVRPADPPVQRWGWATGIAALVAVSLGIAAIVAYVDSTRNNRVPVASGTSEIPELPTDSQENALAIHAATSLAIGLDLDEETLPIDPMPPVAESDTFAMSAESSFFDIPLVIENETGTR